MSSGSAASPLDTPRRPPRNRADEAARARARATSLRHSRRAGAPLRAAALPLRPRPIARTACRLHAAPQATSAPRSPRIVGRERLSKWCPSSKACPNSIHAEDRRASAATRAPSPPLARRACPRAVPPASRAASAHRRHWDPSRSLPERRDPFFLTMLPREPHRLLLHRRFRAGAHEAARDDDAHEDQRAPQLRPDSIPRRANHFVHPFPSSRLPVAFSRWYIGPIMSDERKEERREFRIIGVSAPDKWEAESRRSRPPQGTTFGSRTRRSRSR